MDLHRDVHLQMDGQTFYKFLEALQILLSIIVQGHSDFVRQICIDVALGFKLLEIQQLLLQGCLAGIVV